MKRIILVRHAKTISEGYDNDFNRTLKPVGKDDALRISLKLKEKSDQPELLLSSPAVRAMQTARIYAETFGYPATSIRQEPVFYTGLSTSKLIDHLHCFPDTVSTILLVGHNPTIHLFASELINSFNRSFPTCTTVGIDFKISQWIQLKVNQGELAFYLTPATVQ